MNLFRIAIVTIGDEVLNGDTLNTNAQWLSSQCVRAGSIVVEQRTVADQPTSITAAIRELRQITNLVITTGGLGPTHDDHTVAAVADLFGDQLVLHQPTLEYLERCARERGRTMTERLRRQAMVPRSARVLPNTIGTAPGLLFERSDGAAVMVLPGVPLEMMAIMQTSGLPAIATAIETGGYDVVAERIIVTAGVPESELAERVEPLFEQLSDRIDVAFLPSDLTVRLRLRARGSPEQTHVLLDTAIEKIKTAIGSAFVSDRNEKLVEILQRECTQRSLTLAVAESCTGGMLGSEITSVPGSSAYFLGGLICYSDAVKIYFGGVHPETIALYGAVSRQTVEELSQYVRSAYGADLGVAISGIAGPGGGSPEKPVGTVWIAVADSQGVTARCFRFGENRATVRSRACAAALLMSLERVKSL
ncbi:MAG: CinA family nicotinamide mononucleotide deamidase-related protein [Chlorobi bacterium]|nr:CinA family nicotinamide mononucleotide deamidase-related protein [Chlorobiota bacterium]